MNRNNILYGLLFAACVGLAGNAFAENKGPDDEAMQAQALLAAKVSAVQAAQAAEAKLGGKTSSVSFEAQGGKAGMPFYHVEVVTADGTQQDIAVDSASGEVVKIFTLESKHNGEDGELGGQEDQDGDGISDE